MLHVASPDQKQMAALTGSLRINLAKLKFAQAEAPLRFSPSKHVIFCHVGTLGPLTTPIVSPQSCEKTLVLAGLTIDYLKIWEKTEVLAHQLFVYRPHCGQ